MLRSLIHKTDLLRQNGIMNAVQEILSDPSLSILDIGCGHGQLAARLKQDNPQWQFQGVDVVVQPECSISVSRYDGVTIPYPDDSFDAVFCIDMLHHTTEPEILLKEAGRVARKWVIIKDHIADSKWDHYVLTLLDWLGNAGTGVPLPYNFLSSLEWQALFDKVGLKEVQKLDAIRYWPGIMGQAVDRHYHFVSKLKTGR
ncbi:MAG: methyltransferase domain-containing protein [Methylocystaceae bacterium]|nr:methyltransferase domain-containing protein [Methylocystaceae bacterium]